MSRGPLLEKGHPSRHPGRYDSGLFGERGWKLLGEPLGMGSTIVGVIACGAALAAVSLATWEKHPSRQV